LPGAESEGGTTAIEAYVASLGLDAYLVGGVVRDELLGRGSSDADFLVPGVEIAELAAALAPQGRVEDLVVAGRPVGVRLYPRERPIRALAPAGIDFAPVRRERSTGPGRHDFEIVVDPAGSVQDDLARRDFTINAIARRLADRTLVDPFGGRADLAARVLRTVGPQSFAEDPLRLVRGLRFVSQLDLDPDPGTVAQMRAHAASVGHVSGERIGGGLAADGMGELSKLLLGARPEKALALARDTGVLEELIPSFALARGVREPGWELTLDEHILRVVQVAADLALPLRLRLAALLHDLGKARLLHRGGGAGPLPPPDAAALARHDELGAEIAAAVLARLRYPTSLRREVVAIVRYHSLRIGAGDARAARRLLAARGERLARDLVDFREADLRGKGPAGPVDPEALERHLDFAAVLATQRAQPFRLGDLAVDGRDLIELGYRPGPELGAVLATLLAEVVDDPARNARETLLARARELGPA
jgi:tRNA nucleotidyltransferase/poly(A) polymerase